MTRENDQDWKDSEHLFSEGKKLVLNLTEDDWHLLRLKQRENETDEQTLKRILGESLERDAIESALVKLIESIERLIVIQKREAKKGQGDYRETYRQIQTLENALVGVTELKKMLERNWNKY